LQDLDDNQEKNVSEPEFHLKDGEQLFAYDLDAWIASRVASCDYSEKTETKQSEKDIYEEHIPKCYHEYMNVFKKKDFDQLPDRRPWDHAVELTPGFKQVDCKVYPLNASERITLDKFLEENLRTGQIRPSKSPMASPFFFVKKPDQRRL
jgi:hypothetical protein